MPSDLDGPSLRERLYKMIRAEAGYRATSQSDPLGKSFFADLTAGWGQVLLVCQSRKRSFSMQAYPDLVF